ncbi:Stage IV sporulation protein H [Limihaloglobus sulfuriphilus]|uniref:Stage IV sporulation protein H n=1 Tax=Limihaloglobus sulfuriphilus TaxID=1851148 RepID=A0A1Q2MBX6_9BACT|nr:TlpA disulfide reductase family protein [Limihaloglobus sulfuriphilus]AQQ70038.1 Stage IV sporulation protein H [Limihaloglobus sulfuriphilus]
MKKTAIIITALIFCAVFQGCKKSDTPATAEYSSDLKQVTDVQSSIDEYKGENLLVVFWATWCPPCRKEIPHLNQLVSENESVSVLALSNEKPSTVVEFMQKNEMKYDVASVESIDLPAPFNQVNAIPTIFFISPDGEIKEKVVGGLDYESLKEKALN